MKNTHSFAGRALIPIAVALLTLAPVANAAAQGRDFPFTESREGIATAPLDSLLRVALERNPSLVAATHQVTAARARIGPAGALPSPMLEMGIQNLPLGREQMDPHTPPQPGPDPMTMRMVGIAQTVPFPGKLSLRRRAAEWELVAAEAELEAARWQVREHVMATYAEALLLDRSLEIVARSQVVLGSLVRVTEARYGTGQGEQRDVLQTHVELTRLAEEAVALNERRLAVHARLNSLLDRPSDAPLERPELPERIARAAVAETADQVRFSSATLGARAADSPLPPLLELQEQAVRLNPMLRSHEATIAAQAARAELARKAHLPDFDLSVQYGQRAARPDMISLMLSVQLPLQKSRAQDEEAIASAAELSALHARYRAEANELRAEIARIYSELERERARLALFVRSILPQGRASLESATAGFQVGRVDFMTLLESQATLFDYEIEYHRALSDFATSLAQLESRVGKELLP